MFTDLVYPEVVDKHLGWTLGTARRMARRGKLPHYTIPNGEIRFRLVEIEPLVVRVPQAEKQEAALVS